VPDPTPKGTNLHSQQRVSTTTQSSILQMNRWYGTTPQDAAVVAQLRGNASGMNTFNPFVANLLNISLKMMLVNSAVNVLPGRVFGMLHCCL
jgi:hypothetical protein